MPTALITGITGQDGSYLAELLLSKQYTVIGLISGQYNIGFDNISHFRDQLVLETGDLLDSDSLLTILAKHQPNEIYNLAGMTFVPQSWQSPTLTLNVNTLGLTRLLEILVQKYPRTRIYQASSSKIFGNALKSPQDELTPLNPLDPYSTSKAASHFLINQFRNHFDLFAVSGIMYNHESERRGLEFVTRKITHGAVHIKLGKQHQLALGDLDTQQDWGYAPDYVEAMWLMLQQSTPQDFVIATGKLHTIRHICEIAFSHLKLDYQKYVTIDKQFIRKEKINSSVGNPAKARRQLGWWPRTDFTSMIKTMVDHDLRLATHA